MTTLLPAAEELAARDRARLQRAGEIQRRLETARPPFTAATILDPLNDLMLEVANVGSESSLFSEVHPDLAVREAAETMAQEVEKFGTQLSQSRPLYDALSAVDESALDAVARRALTLTKNDMKRAGVTLDEATRGKVLRLREELVLIEQEFSRNYRDDVRSVTLTDVTELAGLPPDYVQAHPAGPDGAIRVTTNYPDYIPFMAYAKSERARRALYFENNNRCVPRNLELLRMMLAKRHELARLLGYANWADYATEDKMTGSAKAAWEFVEKAYDATRAGAAEETAELLATKREDDPKAERLGSWDLPYYVEKVKRERYDYDSRAMRPYFEYAAVRQAILDLASELFAIRFEPVATELWHPSVETFAVFVDGERRGLISLDMFPRDGKYKHAACFTLRRGLRGKQEPHGVLVCNFPDPRVTKPALMNHSEVVTFFHEFGHLIHVIMEGRVEWMRLTRVNEWDFIEAPSTFLEEWIYDYDVLRRFAKHIETGEPIPEQLVRRMRGARDFGRAALMQRQLWLAAISLYLHDKDPRGLDTTTVVFELSDKYSPTAQLAGTHMEASFGHLEGYTALYYTYLLSTACSRDLLTLFVRGLMDIGQAKRYRDLILAPGGTKPAVELMRDFLGREWSFEAFRTWLSPRRGQSSAARTS